jgi:hypothetical protein
MRRIRTSGSATTRGRDLGIAWHCTVMPWPVGSQTPPRPPPQHHLPAMGGNPNGSRSFAGRASDAPLSRGPADRDGASGSADRPRAGRDIAPPVHSRPRNRSGRGHSSRRSAPERGNAHTRTAGLALPSTQARPHMDGVGNAGGRMARAKKLGRIPVSYRLLAELRRAQPSMDQRLIAVCNALTPDLLGRIVRVSRKTRGVLALSTYRVARPPA